MIKKGTKRSRSSEQLSPVSCDTHLQTFTDSAVKVASVEDLLIQILLHVPVKTLMSFKCVSKQWLSLITNPHFVCLRNPLFPSASASAIFFASSSSKRSNPDYQFIPLDVDECSAPFKSLDFINDPLGSGVSVLQSCGGLLLCASYRAGEINRRYYVYNPTTGQFNTLPQISREYSKYVCSMSLAYDPGKSPYYKVVCVRRSETCRQLFQIEIYSSETRLWRVSGQPFTPPIYTEFQNSIFWNGSVHWWNGSVHWWNGFVYGAARNDKRRESFTLYFKVEEERVEQLQMPRTPWYRIASYVGESEGHWHLVERYSDFNSVFNVYELERDYSGWFMKYQVDLSDLTILFPEIRSKLYRYTVNIISLVRKGKKDKEDGSFLVLEIPGGIIRYNLVDKSVKKLLEFAHDRKFYNDDCLRHVSALSYIPSLACV
ncbi:F-box domain containing protein [Heracleum sosnowskyi]|uniref:F-box domain containing protein n=1 Tax=Heracleum sosnowskyi TaxID=360622 RepID=A0AAD8J8I9_9APIA|nr:F-box domain containing protein [Heracleum sosnowskyi]